MIDRLDFHSTEYTEKLPSPMAAVLVLTCLELLVLTQALFAYADGFLTVSQMRQRGIDQGLPFVWHFAMWSDLVIISPLIAYIVIKFCRGWSTRSMIVSAAIGLVCSGFLHWLYSLSGIAGAHIQNHALTRAGVIHALYMWVAASVFTQFFLFTRHVSRSALAGVSVLLIIHVFIGTHMVLGIINIYFPQSWYPDQPLKSFPGWATIGAVSVGLIWRNIRGT